ncbi:MAG TPA: hypothetical protein VGX26_09755 [Solirubrobacteraceae bacterium]|nr:hypothetical protein [Solirubrobacteraceae bacterium]
MTSSATPAGPDAQVPSPPSERGPWLLALALAALGVGMLLAVLTGMLGSTTHAVPTAAPPPVLVAAATPVPGAAASASVLAGATGAQASLGVSRASLRAGRGRGRGRRLHGAVIVAQPLGAQQSLAARRLTGQTETEIPARWMEGFYPIYATAQRTFGVNWLLIASIHKQESAFSTAPGTYHGLNFAGCCGGPMQFNVMNGSRRPGTGSGSTWQLVSSSYIYGRRPAAYDHMAVKHPSIYDDFDAIMAAAHLLSADGAEYALDGAAWAAAYDYYGHDTTGVSYADQVLARAIGWSQHGFCINCGVEEALAAAVHAAYGAPVLALLTTATTAGVKPKPGK